MARSAHGMRATPARGRLLGTSPAAARLGGLMASGEAPVTETARGAFARAVREGFGGGDIAGIAQVYA